MTITALELLPPAGSRIAVFGAGGGIGRVLVEQLLARGVEVFALDLPGALAALQPGGGLATRELDVASSSSLRSALRWLAERAPVLDGYVNLIGFTQGHAHTADLDPELWREVIHANLDAAFLLAQGAIPLLRGSRNASLVHVASALGVNTRAAYAHYAAAKAGLIALTKAIAREEAPRIRANNVAPSAVDTPFLHGGTQRSVEALTYDLDAYIQSLPLKRLAQPLDVVGPILFLLGPGSAYVSGETLLVTGAGYVR